MPIETPTAPWGYVYSPYRLQDDTELPAYEVFSEDGKICDINEELPPEKQEAVACLIAALPELLAALEAQAMADADPEASRRKGYFERARDMRKQALAAAGRMVW